MNVWADRAGYVAWGFAALFVLVLAFPLIVAYLLGRIAKAAKL